MNTNFGSIEKSSNVETSIVKKDEKPELPNGFKKDDVEKITNIQEGSYIHRLKRSRSNAMTQLQKVCLEEHMKLFVN